MKLIDRLLPLEPLTIKQLINFWMKVDRKGPNDCWLWIGGKSAGYGSIGFNGRIYVAHRISYYIHNMKDPGKLLVCHTCNTPLCMNPKHFYLGTHVENNQQAHDEGRRNQEGELNQLAKLKEVEVIEIRDAVGNGERISDKAKEYKVAESTIRDLVNRKSWKHI